MQRRVVLGVLMVSGAALLAGCATGGGSAGCPSWASFPTAEERYDEASVVITTAAVDRAGTEVMLGVNASAYDVTVALAEKGKAAPGDHIRVISMPDPCGAFYVNGDPMATVEPLRLYLRYKDDQWVTITPLDGVELLVE
jgi:hypothetical protein